MNHITLNDTTTLPQFGLGVWQVANDIAERTVLTALDAGYRAIDTAAIYGNEEGVGAALAATTLPRKDIAVTTKLWNADQGYDSTLRALEESLRRLRLDYVDLYLIHWPVPKAGRYVDTWKAFTKIKADGLARSIGVSNFNPAHIERLITETGIAPSVNQVELHPAFPQKTLREFHAKHGIATEAWSPLGQGKLLADATLAAIAKKHGKTPAQVIIRWHLQLGNIVIPKSATPSRIIENITVFDFMLDAGDLAAIDALDKGAAGRIGPDPGTFSMGL
jgi:2,5-diketo-D-gluconate reductase A